MKRVVEYVSVCLILMLAAPLTFSQGYGGTWQQPKKPPETIKEKEKSKPSKDQGSDRRSKERDEKKKDEKKKPD